MTGLLSSKVLAMESVLLQGEGCALPSCVACMSNSATFNFQNRLIFFCEPDWEVSHEASGIGTILDDSRESDNIVIYGTKACGTIVPSSVREAQTKLGVYVGVGRIVLTPLELVLLVLGTEGTNTSFFLKISLQFF